MRNYSPSSFILSFDHDFDYGDIDACKSRPHRTPGPETKTDLASVKTIAMLALEQLNARKRDLRLDKGLSNSARTNALSAIADQERVAWALIDELRPTKNL